MCAFSVILLGFGSGWLRRKKLFQYAQNFFSMLKTFLQNLCLAFIRKE